MQPSTATSRSRAPSQTAAAASRRGHTQDDRTADLPLLVEPEAPQPPSRLSPLEALSTTPIDRESVPQGRLDIAQRVRTNLLPWHGQFSPQLVEGLLSAYARPGEVVLDPFVGSGTSLVEAARLELASFGSDLNPAAVALARVYRLINLDTSARTDAVHLLRQQLDRAIGTPYGPLFCDNSGLQTRKELEAALVQLWRDSNIGPTKDLAAALVILCDFFQKRLDAEIVYRNWQRLERLVQHLPGHATSVSVHHADARALAIESGTIDLVVTSPPYINVHNYHQQFRRSIEALECNVLPIARSEIGSNRQNRGNRFRTVTQYALDMVLALLEMARTAKIGAHLILVLGRESSVRGTRFFNSELVAELAVSGVGLVIERRQERVFRNRFGKNIYEDILHFRNTPDVLDREDALAAARLTAKKVLAASRSLTPKQESPGLEEALARIDESSPSPMPPPSTLTQLSA